MSQPLLTDTEAHQRAAALLAHFMANPDVLSPDEQALAMEIVGLKTELQALVAGWQKLSEIIGSADIRDCARELAEVLAKMPPVHHMEPEA